MKNSIILFKNKLPEVGQVIQIRNPEGFWLTKREFIGIQKSNGKFIFACRGDLESFKQIDRDIELAWRPE